MMIRVQRNLLMEVLNIYLKKKGKIHKNILDYNSIMFINKVFI